MNTAAIAAEIDAIERRLDRLKPLNNRPDAYHEEKSEIRKDLRAIATWLRTGRMPGE